MSLILRGMDTVYIVRSGTRKEGSGARAFLRGTGLQTRPTGQVQHYGRLWRAVPRRMPAKGSRLGGLVVFRLGLGGFRGRVLHLAFDGLLLDRRQAALLDHGNVFILGAIE